MTIGERLKEERSRLGLSQTDLGAIGGVGKTTQINYEKGDRSPDAAYLAAAAAAGVDILYVVTGQRALVPADSLTAEEAKVLENYRGMAPADKASVMRLTTLLARADGNGGDVVNNG
jgi:transcriptional regulator with XRE-family HTH domain